MQPLRSNLGIKQCPNLTFSTCIKIRVKGYTSNFQHVKRKKHSKPCHFMLIMFHCDVTGKKWLVCMTHKEIHHFLSYSVYCPWRATCCSNPAHRILIRSGCYISIQCRSWQDLRQCSLLASLPASLASLSACSIWWTPASVQVTGENKREREASSNLLNHHNLS